MPQRQRGLARKLKMSSCDDIRRGRAAVRWRGQELFCLDLATGELLWHNKLGALATDRFGRIRRGHCSGDGSGEAAQAWQLIMSSAPDDLFFPSTCGRRPVFPPQRDRPRWRASSTRARSALFSSSAFWDALSTQDPWLATLFTALSSFAAHSAETLWWSCAIGISPGISRCSAMNSVGVFGAMSSQYLVGAIADWLDQKATRTNAVGSDVLR
jgi:hypothetical protein